MLPLDHGEAANEQPQPPREPDCGLTTHRRELFDAFLLRCRRLAKHIASTEPTFAEWSRHLTDVITSYHDRAAIPTTHGYPGATGPLYGRWKWSCVRSMT